MKLFKENFLAFGLMLVTLAFGFAVLYFAATAGGGAEESSGGGEASAGTGDEAAGAENAPTTLSATLSEFAITGNLSAEPGEIVIDVQNDGAIAHNLSVLGEDKTSDLNGGEAEVLSLGNLAAGTYTVVCDIPGHRESGMETELIVGEGLAAGDDSGSEPDYAAIDAAFTASILEFPAETEGKGNQVLEPEILADGTKYFELTTEITKWETEPGRVVDAWTYNGTVPGPAIKIQVGDKIRVKVINKLPMGTDIHWHGIRTPNSEDGVAPITQALIESGTEYEYNFVAEKEAIGMFHAHHAGQIQVPNGLLGTFQIGEIPIPRGQTISGVTIPEDIEIAQEIPMVLNDAGEIGYSLNGKGFPGTEPYVVQAGDWVVANYYNEGLQIHPMHLHQFAQLIIAKDGIPLDQPYWADTVNVAPGERYTVLINPDTEGTWVWHCHILSHVEREDGVFGMLTAMVVQAS
ncbi:MAG: multicopper oxidase domain-containing protein [Actinomycetia bacterium]|nr:multicopper oxidase domain-containing protein [Actinomycetes bacterium]